MSMEDFGAHYKDKSMEWFFEKYDTLPGRTWEKLARKVEIDGAYTIENSLVSMGQLVKKPRGEQFEKKKITEGWTIMRSKGDAYGYQYDISEEEIRDGSVDRNLKKVTQEWASDYHRTAEVAFHDIFTYGGYTAGHATFDMSVPGMSGLADPSGLKCYDGFPFFTPTATKRSNKAGGTYFNAHTAELNPTNLTTVFLNQTSTNAYNERGEKIVLIPDILYVPQALQFTADAMINSTYTPFVTQNEENVWKGKLEVVVDPWLTSSTAWFLGTKKKGLWYWVEGDPVIDVFENKVTKGYSATIWARFRFGVDNFRPWDGVNVATS